MVDSVYCRGVGVTSTNMADSHMHCLSMTLNKKWRGDIQAFEMQNRGWASRHLKCSAAGNHWKFYRYSPTNPNILQWVTKCSKVLTNKELHLFEWCITIWSTLITYECTQRHNAVIDAGIVKTRTSAETLSWTTSSNGQSWPFQS